MHGANHAFENVVSLIHSTFLYRWGCRRFFDYLSNYYILFLKSL